MPSTGCGDTKHTRQTQQQGPDESVGGPSIRLLGSLPVFKARRQFNRGLDSEDSLLFEEDAVEDEDASISVSGTSRVVSSRASSAPMLRRPVRRSSPAKAKVRKATPPSMSLLAPGPRKRVSKRQSVSDRATSCNELRRPHVSDVRKSPALQLQPHPAVPQVVVTSPLPSPQLPLLPTPQTRRMRQVSSGDRQRKPKSRRLPHRLEPECAANGPINYMQVYHRLRKGRFGFLYDYPAFGATTSSSPAHITSRSDTNFARKPQPLKQCLGIDRPVSDLTLADVSASTSCISIDAAAETRVAAPTESKITAPASSYSAETDTADTGGAVGSGISRLLRLLHEREEDSSLEYDRGTETGLTRGAATVEVATFQVASLAPRPVPKPRRCISTSTLSGTAMGAGVTSAMGAGLTTVIRTGAATVTCASVAPVLGTDLTPATGASVTPVIGASTPSKAGIDLPSVMGAGGTSSLRPEVAASKPASFAAAPPPYLETKSSKQPAQSMPLSLATFGTSYFSLSSIDSAEPFGPPRIHRLAPTPVNAAAALEPAPVAWRRVSYRCVDSHALQRLSVTGLLLGRHDPAAPCRWLGSAALLTHLRFPSRVELPARTELVASDPKCGAATLTSHQDIRFDVAISVDPAGARFAFQAMRRRRSSHVRRVAKSGIVVVEDGVVEAPKSGQTKSNLYSVPVG